MTKDSLSLQLAPLACQSARAVNHRPARYADAMERRKQDVLKFDDDAQTYGMSPFALATAFKEAVRDFQGNSIDEARFTVLLAAFALNGDFSGEVVGLCWQWPPPEDTSSSDEHSRSWAFACLTYDHREDEVFVNKLRPALAMVEDDDEARDQQESEGDQNQQPHEQFVTLDQAAALVNRHSRTLRRKYDAAELPEPDVHGGGGKAHEWNWSRLRPELQRIFKRDLPEHFPNQHPAE